MRRRLTASAIALVILVTGLIPAVAGYRCVMGMQMDAPSPCCRHADETAAVKAPCCEAVAAVRLEPRRTPSSLTTIQPPAPVGSIVFPPPSAPLASVDRATPARARGRPPGERLQLYSTVLRI